MGSFLNVCICRIPEGESIISPPSSCPSCKRRLKPSELVPVLSWLFQKGKCRGCGSRISIRYPLTELACAGIYLWIYIVHGFTLESLALIFLMSVLFIAFFIDLDKMIIPDGVVITGLAGGGLLYIYFILSQVTGVIKGPEYLFYNPSEWYTPLLGMISSSGFLFIIALVGFLIYRGEGAMGMGDVKLYLPIGLFLGWKLSLLSLFGSFVIGGAAASVMMIFKIKDRKSEIPFGPYIIISTFICALYGNRLLNWYFGTMGI